MKNYEACAPNNRKLVKSVYWGTNTFNPNEGVVAINRDELIEKYGLKKIIKPNINSDVTFRIYKFDHTECYLCEEGKILLLTSPYCNPDPITQWDSDADKINNLKALGFIEESPVYNTSAITFVQQFVDRKAFTKWKKDHKLRNIDWDYWERIPRSEWRPHVYKVANENSFITN